MAQTVFLEAINQAITEEMRRDESVFIMGEDIRLAVYGATANLLGEFGEKRVLDTPLSENGFFGAAVGASLVGMRPIVETLTSFMWVGMDQLVSQAAKMRYMFGGQATVPVVYRMAMGAGLGAAGQHSDTLYSLYTHIPGLKVVVPSSPYDAKGLLLSSIQDDNPVLFFEHMGLYGQKGPVPEESYTIPLGEASVLREGSDVTIVAISMMTVKAMEAADQLLGEGVTAEVIDPRTLSPLDVNTLSRSVEKTGRLVIVDESPPRCSIAADIAAIVGENVFDALQAPIQRVTAPHTPVPMSPPLEQAYIPSTERVLAAVRSTFD